MTTEIEWVKNADGTKGKSWNPVTGCSKLSPGCAGCYAETATARFAGSPGWIEEHRPWTPENAEHNVRLHPDRLEVPLRRKKPTTWFVNSMSDLFHEQVPAVFIARVFLTMERAPQHTFQVLTKRPEQARMFFELAERFGVANPLPGNVWLGVSIENARYTWRADVLRHIPAAVRFVSAEPLLGSLFDGGLSCTCGGETRSSSTGLALCSACGARRGGRAPLDLTGIDWLIAGGESGPGARPMHPDWARELRDACVEHGVAFFFKQWGSWAPVGWQNTGARRYVDVPARDVPYERLAYVGPSPKSGGRKLDGREWDELPAAALEGRVVR